MDRLEALLNDYMDRHGLEYKYMKERDNYISIRTMCYTELEATLINGRVYFKVNGKRHSIYK